LFITKDTGISTIYIKLVEKSRPFSCTAMLRTVNKIGIGHRFRLTFRSQSAMYTVLLRASERTTFCVKHWKPESKLTECERTAMARICYSM